MKRFLAMFLVGLGAAFFGPQASEAQEPSGFLAVGEVAPDIEVTGATRYGVLTDAVTLGDFRGETVVLAFFFKVRTGG